MSDASDDRRGPTAVQRAWLRRGLDQPGGKLPLYDGEGQEVDTRTIRACLEQGWAEPWFDNPLKPGWLVCKLTETGRALAAKPKRPPPRAAKAAPRITRPIGNVTPIR